MLRAGLIGCGGMGTNHSISYEVLGDMVEIVAVADLQGDKATEIAKKFGSKIYVDGKDLIQNEKLDFVDICLPTYLHTEFAVMAMEKGLDVFMEKPVCLNPEEGKILNETQKRTGAKVQIGQVMRFWAEYVWIKDILNSGEYGKIVSASFERLSPNPTWGWENWYNDPEKSGSMALDLHIHDVDFVRFLFDAEPKLISATAARDTNGTIEQIFTAYNVDNAVVTVEGCWDFPDNFPFSMNYRVKFEKATAVFEQNKLTVYTVDGKVIEPEIINDFECEKDIGINVASVGAYYNELRHFVTTLSNNEDITIAPLCQAVKSLELDFEGIKIAGGISVKGK